MWSRLMRFLDDGAQMLVGEIQGAGGNLKGMERWGYAGARTARR
jgi:hypothetical protein